jgi:hypothetical protein
MRVYGGLEFVTQNSSGCLPLAVGEKSRVAEYWKDAPSLNRLKYTNLWSSVFTRVEVVLDHDKDANWSV